MMENKRLLNVKEVSERWNISPWTVRAWVSQRRIPHVKLGGKAVRFDIKDLEA